MMNTSLITNISSDTSGEEATSIWLNMEQEYIPEPNQSASEVDALNMLSVASGGTSSLSYLMNNCSYVKVVADAVIVTLRFYVWPSSLDLQYKLTADTGDISQGANLRFVRSLDAVVDGTDSTSLGFLYEGTSTKSMPFLLLNGDIYTKDRVTIANGNLYTSVTGYCVYRLNGRSIGYQHTVTMTIPKTNAQQITGFNNNIIAEWVDSSGKLETTTLSLVIPSCVSEALLYCESPSGDGLAYDDLVCSGQGVGGCEADEQVREVYYNSCDGKTIMDERWVENT